MKKGNNNVLFLLLGVAGGAMVANFVQKQRQQEIERQLLALQAKSQNPDEVGQILNNIQQGVGVAGTLIDFVKGIFPKK